MKVHFIKQDGVASLELKAHGRQVGRTLINDLARDRPIEGSTVSAGGGDFMEALWNHVHGRCINATVGECDPQVDGSDALAEKGSVLMPSVGSVAATRDATQRGFLD